MEMNIDEVISNILNKEALLFLGAGASTATARNKKGSPLPTGNQLSARLTKECDLDREYSLDTITEYVIDEKGQSFLADILKEELDVHSYTASLEELAKQDWIRVWTTNYDLSFEKCARSESNPYFSMSTSRSVDNARGNRKLVVHINGKLDDLTNDIPEDFILTSKDYATNHFLDSEWSHTFRHDLTRAKSIIFIGYSLADIDIARIIFNSDRIKRKVIFIEHQDIDPIFSNKLKKFGMLSNIGVDNFSDLIKEKSQSWVKPQKLELYRSFDKLAISDRLASGRSSDDNFYNLIIKGEVINDHLVTPQEDSRYTIERNKEERMYSNIVSGGGVALIYSSFANGKSILSRRLGLQLSQSGLDAFILSQKSYNTEQELLKMCDREHAFVLIIENYQRNIALVELFLKNAKPSCSLIITERTEAYELSYEKIEELASGWSLQAFNIDYLCDEEIKSISSLLAYRGLWKDLDRKTELEKIGYLKRECGGTLQGILLKLLESPQVKDRLEELISGFKKTEQGKITLITLCLLVCIGENPTTEDLEDALNLSYFDYNKLNTNSELRQILTANNREISFKSPVVAASILKNFESAEEITEVVCIIEKNLYKFKSDSRIKDICTSLIRFGNLEKILPTRHKREALQNLYEELKNITHFEEDPLFWLQYAIARLTLGDTDKSRDYFRTALAKAKSRRHPNFNPYQIETHFCRQLLVDAADSSDSEIAYKFTIEALDTLKKQSISQSQTRHHPYRASWGIESVLHRHTESWTIEQCNVVMSKIGYLQDSANKLSPSVAKQTPVIGALQRYKSALKLLNEKIKTNGVNA